MQLRDYLHREWLTGADMARMVGVSRTSMARYLNGERVPDPDIMTAIERATNGAVGPRDWPAQRNPRREAA